MKSKKETVYIPVVIKYESLDKRAVILRDIANMSFSCSNGSEGYEKKKHPINQIK